MKNNSFTLIEILVVSTIIVLLTSIAAVSYSQFTKTSRDARRKADLEQIRAALEMYRSNVDSYPTTSQGLISLTSPTVYIQSIPQDPKTKGDYPYISLTIGCDGTSTNPCNDYSITATLDSGGTYIVGPYGSVTGIPTPIPTSAH